MAKIPLEQHTNSSHDSICVYKQLHQSLARVGLCYFFKRSDAPSGKLNTTVTECAIKPDNYHEKGYIKQANATMIVTHDLGCSWFFLTQ